MNLKKATVVCVFFVTLTLFLSPFRSDARDYGSAKNNFGMTKSRIKCIERWRPFLEKLSAKKKESLSKGKKPLGIDWKDPMAQIIYEGAEDKSALAVNKNNNMGINAYPTANESAYEHASSFSSKENCVRYYYDFVPRIYKRAIEHPNNPYAFINDLAAKYAPGSTAYKVDTHTIIDQISLYAAYCDQKDIDKAEKTLKKAKEKRRKAKKALGAYQSELEETNRNRIASSTETYRRKTHNLWLAKFSPELIISSEATISTVPSNHPTPSDRPSDSSAPTISPKPIDLSIDSNAEPSNDIKIALPPSPDIDSAKTKEKKMKIKLKKAKMKEKKMKMKLKNAKRKAKPNFHTLALGVKYGRFSSGEARKRMFGKAEKAIMAEYKKVA